MFPYLNTSILRERFVIRKKTDNKSKDAKPTIALGNRIVVTLKATDGRLVEHIVVRGQNMHSVARAAAQIFQDFNKKGTILHRIPTYDWEGMWMNVRSSYEQIYNTENWIAIYYKGRLIYKDGNYHPFLDIMEQCDASNRDEYDEAVKIAEGVFLKAGKAVEIEKETNIAAVIGVSDFKARCGLILRGPQKSSTFNFSFDPKNDGVAGAEKPFPHICLNMCAAFLEGIQLAFLVGRLKALIRNKNLSKSSEESRQMTSASRRIGRLNSEIKSYENTFEVRFRPERPDMFQIIEDTERMFLESSQDKD